MKNLLAGLAMLAGTPQVLLAGSLSGTVVDRITLLPVPAAYVTLHVLLPDSIAYPDTSGEAGEYSIDGIVTGNQIYVIMAWKSGYKPYYFRYDTIGPGSYAFDVILDPDTASSGGGGGDDSSEVTGQVFGKDRVSGALSPLVGAEVRLVSGLNQRTLHTGTDGLYGAMLPVGSYAITVTASGYATGSSGGVFVGEEGLTYGTILVSPVTSVALDGTIPSRFGLLGAYPNPFNPTTQIAFSLPDRMPVRLTIHNMLGEDVATVLDATLPPGLHTATFRADGLASGVYLYRLQAGSYMETRKLVFVR